MKLGKVDAWLLKILYLIVAGIIVTQILDLDDLTSMLFTLTFPMTVLLWLRSVRRALTGTDMLMLCAVAMATLSVLLDASISNARVGFEYLRKLIMFIMSLLFLQTANRVRVDQSFAVFMDKLVDFLTVIFVAAYFLRFTQMHTLNGHVTVYLTFRFTNPNLTGMFLICLYMMQTYRLFTPERWYRKLVHIVMAGFLASFVIQTQSRNCLLALVLFTAVSLWLVFRARWNLRVSKFWAGLIASLPILFTGLYMTLVYTPWIQKLFAFLVGEGKGLDARVRVWTPAFNAIRTSPLIGQYCDISNGTGMSQMHNSHLDIATSYGVPVLILVMVLLFRYLYQKGKKYSDKSSFLYMLAFACTILLGIGEAALFSGGMGIYVLIGALLLLANKDTTDEMSRE